MAPVVFIDLWPEVAKRGYWKKRFAAVPVAIVAADYRPVVQHYTRLDVRALTAQPPAGIILSGSRSNLLDDPSLDPKDGIALSAFTKLTALLENLPHVPVLGICFGLQYLMVATGGTLARLPRVRREPAWAITLLERDPLFSGLRAPHCVESHVWRVERPAHGYRVIARSADGIEGVRHATQPRVGVQFHPEYHRQPGATKDGERMLQNWLGSLRPTSSGGARRSSPQR
ncbi:MAG TPA: gamma-glutamyl-gamma-aminobutyrate hydrolase family protein [Planctomycetota bacterium]|jgi:GMP synthase-like glutamine amidotransferase|nr:gamma-glutamyl-gamma-aminobutyrate hydrolase family protein [Planctomycetota bacterium]